MSSPVHPQPSNINTAATVAVAPLLDRDLSFTDRRAAVERGDNNNAQNTEEDQKKELIPKKTMSSFMKDMFCEKIIPSLGNNK
mmetsp:Transcript_18012/g.32740  ORF Transcript_18012/g.32740 Transcript_18012/m.32740 type:complete len:83 (-) Transcript_18012:228-476(-)